MNPFIARVVYCVVLGFLAACSVLPTTPAPAPKPVAINTAPALAHQLAAATRNRVEAERLYGPKHPAMIEAVAVETALRAYADIAQPEGFHDELVKALSNELASAMARREMISLFRGEKRLQMQRAQGLVRELTIAVNSEVHTPS